MRVVNTKFLFESTTTTNKRTSNEVGLTMNLVITKLNDLMDVQDIKISNTRLEFPEINRRINLSWQTYVYEIRS